MKSFIKTLAALIAVLMLLPLAACTAGNNAQPDPTQSAELPETSAETPTEAPTEAPTQEPTEAPTEAPTPEPTATPAPTELAFVDCAEEIIRLTPSRDAETEYYYYHREEDEEDGGPSGFYISGDYLYIHCYTWFTKVSLVDGSSTRYDPPRNYQVTLGGLFAALDNMIVTNGSVYNFETGELTAVIPAVYKRVNDVDNSIRHIFVRDGKVYAYVYIDAVWNEEDRELISAPHLDEYEFSTEEMAWIPIRKLIDYVPTPENRWMQSHYTMAFADTGRPTECDPTGYTYGFEWTEDMIPILNYVVRKYSPEGCLLSSVTMPFNEFDMFGNTLFLVGEDGYMYVLASYPEELVLYRLHM